MKMIFKRKPPVETLPFNQKLSNKVMELYHKTFLEDAGLQKYLAAELGLKDKSLFAKYKIGFSNGALLKTIPENGTVIESLKQAGILDLEGKEIYSNCLVLPQLDPDGNCLSLTGKKLTELNPKDLAHLIPADLPAPPPLNSEAPQIEARKDELFIRYAERKYLIRGIEYNHHRQLKVNIKAINQTRFYIDSLDLYAAKSRKIFAKETALLFHTDEQTTDTDLNSIIEETESYLKSRENNQAQVPVVSDIERDEALKFLKSPAIVKQILSDFETTGYCGEETNKILGYLVAISRKLDDPLSLLILSRSAAGKSTLQDAVLELVPQEDKIKYTRITGNALFYTQQGALDHKIIAIEEEEGAQDAAYSIRIMQSAKSLTSATTIKDPLTGEMKTKEYHTKINSALMYTTTNGSIDYETMSRFIIATIDESKQQTQAIHAVQRKKDTLEGLLKDTAKDQVIKKHHNAQRLLRPLKVVNPYAPYLTFIDGRLRARRDNKKYLGLIKAIAFLHQYQRPIKTIEQNKKPIEYIEVDLNDIVFANSLANEVLGRSLDELSPQARNLLTMLKKMKQEAQAKGISRAQVSRRDIRVFTGWSDHQVRDHLQQLIDLEYVAIVAGKNGYRFLYELIYDGGGEDGNKFMMGLVDIKTLKERMNTRLPCG